MYRMPAEWQRHSATWLSWPTNETTFPGKHLEAVRESFVRMIEALKDGERVNVLVDDEKTRSVVSTLVGKDRDSVFFHLIRTEDVWIRDYGPMFVESVEDKQVVALKWTFNAWGNKYDDLVSDNLNGLIVARLSGFKVLEPGIILEGGSIDVNGQGTLLTTKQCLLNGNRNAGLDKEKIEGYLDNYLGAEEIIWLNSGIDGDDTDGHVDDIARFVSESKIICMIEQDQLDSNSRPLRENYDLLRDFASTLNRSFEVIPLEMPRKKVVDPEGNRLPASYANFYIGNAAVLVPVFGDENDGAAVETISSLFGSRNTVPINCTALVAGFGAIHCVTQQEPAL